MEEYASQISKRVIFDVADNVGFNSVRVNACDALGDVIGIFISSLGKKSVSYSQLGNRTEVALHDVVAALEELSFAPKDLSNYLGVLEEDILEPFDSNIPSFPIPTISVLQTRGVDEPTPVLLPQNVPIVNGTSAPTVVAPVIVIPPQQDTKIPGFLAPFPPKHTYKFSSVASDRIKDPKLMQKLKTRGHRHLEVSLSKLHTEDLGEIPSKNQDRSLRIINPYLNVVQKIPDEDVMEIGDVSSVKENNVTLDKNDTDSILLDDAKKKILDQKDSQSRKRKCDEILEGEDVIN